MKEERKKIHNISDDLFRSLDQSSYILIFVDKVVRLLAFGQTFTSNKPDCLC